MSLLMLLAALAVVGVLAAVVTGRLDPSLPPPTSSSPHRPLPDGVLKLADVDAVRFSLAVRGYRMDEVDSVLARLRAELSMLHAQLAAHGGGEPAGDVTTTTDATILPPGALPASTGGFPTAEAAAAEPRQLPRWPPHQPGRPDDIGITPDAPSGVTGDITGGVTGGVTGDVMASDRRHGRRARSSTREP